ncbi:MAG: hypothetical protein DMG28_10840 [Acidobacteria bacterium]|nr:MAG: hypothetical protein DMG28_10840 [Acidobacteriota bacterium]
MRILITGATGFVGCHMLAPLIEREHEVFSLERHRSWREPLGASTAGRPVFCDLRDHFAVRQVVRDVQPEAVIHLAAISPVSYSYNHPNEILEANLIGTVNLAEACLREVPQFRQFLFASSSETYGKGPVPKTEEMPQNPNSPYSVSKLAAEKYVLYLRDAYRLPATVLRLFNTYGRKDNADFVVERTIVQMLRGHTVRLGAPSPVRDLLYVDDHVNAYLSCLGNEKAIGGIFNFSTGRGVSVSELVGLLASLTGFVGEVAWDTIPRRPLDIDRMIGDSSQAEKILGWRPRVNLEEGLRLCIAHWKQRLDSVRPSPWGIEPAMVRGA